MTAVRRRGGSGAVDAVVVGLGPERPGRRDHPGRSRAVGDGRRRGRHGRRWMPYRDEPGPASFTTSARPSTRCSRPRPSSAAPTFDGARRALRPSARSPFAHPLDGGRAAVVTGSVEETAARLGVDALALPPALARSSATPTTSPARSSPRCAPSPASAGDSPASACEGLLPSRSAGRTLRDRGGPGTPGRGGRPRGASARRAAHRRLRPVHDAHAHSVGWPVVEGGSARIIDALVAELESLGGHVDVGHRVRHLHELPPARRCCSTSTTGQLIALAGQRLSRGVPSRALTLPLRARGLQARLGAVGAGSVAGGELSGVGHVCISAARWTSRPLRSRRRRKAAIRSGRSASSSSPGSPTRRGHRPDSTRSGATATFHRVRRST